MLILTEKPQDTTPLKWENNIKFWEVLMRAQAFADRRPDRVVWNDRRWKWVGIRQENGDFDAPSYVDLEAREVWFYQAIGASPAMFRRKPGSGIALLARAP